jgi:hypothetical protein
MRTLVLLVLAGCSQQSSAAPEQAEPPRPVQLDRPAVVQFHMRTHLDDLRTIERHLIAGRLEDARATAFMLTKPAKDPGLEPWQPQMDHVVAEANGLVDAKTIDDGCRRVARVAEACAECHIKTQTTPVFPTAAPPPGDDGSPLARMVRHQWAVDRLWEGMVAGTNEPWVGGLEILASSPLPFTTLTEAPALATRLQQLASDALARHRDQSETLDSRTAAYGEMLVTCSACHSSLQASPVARQ